MRSYDCEICQLKLPPPKLTTCVLGCILLVILSGCGLQSSIPGASSPPAGDQLSIGIAQPLDSLNPVTIVNNEEANFSHFIWAGLLGINARGTLFPMLAESVPSTKNGLISQGGREITFKLRPNLRWSDGAPITGADVRFGWQVAVKPWATLCPATCSEITSVATGKGRSVTFDLSYPYSPLMFGLPPVLPRHQIWRGSWQATFRYLYQAGTDYLSPAFAVDGPYLVRSASASLVTFEPNPHWNLFGRPAFRRVTVQTFATDKDLMSAQQRGAVQMSQGYNDVDFARKVIVPARLGSMRMRLLPLQGVEHLEPNLLGRYLNDVRVRQALSLAIDRARLTAYSLQMPIGLAKNLVAYTPESPGRFDGLSVDGVWDPIQHRFVPGPRPDDARRLLAEAGWILHTNGLRYRRGCPPSVSGCQLDLLLLAPKENPVRLREAQTLATEWRGVGVNTNIDDVHWSLGNLLASFDQRGPCAHGSDDLCLFAQSPGIDPQTDFQLEFTSNHIARKTLYPSQADINYPGVRDPRLDRIFARAPRTYDLEARARLYRRWQIEVAKNVYWIPLYRQPLIIILRRTIRNLKPSPVAVEWNPWALAP